MVAQPDSMTASEYLAMEAASPIKHEYVNGAVYAMAGGTSSHDRVANNVRAALVVHLGEGPCSPFGPDMRVRVSPTIYYYPDALVTCEEEIAPDALDVSEPRLIVEVLSQSTETNDRGDKFADYQTVAGFEEYLLVASRRRMVERYRRAEHGRWIYQRYGPDDEVTIETIGLTIAVARFYIGTRVPG